MEQQDDQGTAAEESPENGQALLPVEQQTLSFYGKPIMVVRLPDGSPAVVLRFLCENMGLEPRAQIRRIRSTEVIAPDLAYARVQTEGGPQTMAVLVLHGATFWLATIDAKRVRPDIREEVLRYQREVVDVLYAWAAAGGAAPAALAPAQALVPAVTAEPVTEPPVMPQADAPPELWIAFHEQMALWHRWRLDFAGWQGSVESRLEGVEEMSRLIPEILDRLPPSTLTPAHQRQLQGFVKQLHETTGKPYAFIYEDLKTAFAAPRYQDIAESDWEQVVQWFRVQLQRKRGGK